MSNLVRWDQYFVDLAIRNARMSKDPNRGVGAVLVRDRAIISTGYNGFPRGVADDVRLHDKQTKLPLIVHAEMNAILNAAREGLSTLGATLYIAALDKDTDFVWGGPPCMNCAKHVIQAGIREVVYLPMKVDTSWAVELWQAADRLVEAGVGLRVLQP